MTALKEKQGAAKWEAVRTTKLTLTDAQINKNMRDSQTARFERVFAYFCRGAKVGAESGAAQAPGYRYETASPRRAERGEETA